MSAIMLGTLKRMCLFLPLVLAVRGETGEKLSAPVQAVRDEIGLFSLEARQKATLDAAYVQDHFKKDLRFEAVAAPPVPPGLDVKDPTARNRFFEKWAGARYKASGIDGILIVIAPQAKSVQVVVGSATIRSGFFSAEDRQSLRNILLKSLGNKKPDEALVQGAKFVRNAMDRHLAAKLAADPTGKVLPSGEPGAAIPGAGGVAGGPGAAKETPWTTYLLIGLAVLVGIWLLSALFRGLSSMGGGGSGAQAGSGGGGFMTGMLGGLFGAMAGMWLYNNVFGGSSLSAGEQPQGGDFSGSGPAGAAGAGGAAQELGDEPTVSGGEYGGDEEKYGGGDWGDTDAGGWGDDGGDWGDGGDW